ncbi:hypothetical protein BC832DRAFT_537619 [Gaertneriomyces semiglobifer]|nr:hypothetical protein BC832DRAFT_537619 [Gaertneriomyces semiglobifer]
MLRFEDCFWGTGEDPTLGVRTLHELFAQHLAEASDLADLVRARIVMEEHHASHFLELARHSGHTPKDKRRYSRASTPAIAAGTMTGLNGEKKTFEWDKIVEVVKEGVVTAAEKSKIKTPASWKAEPVQMTDTSTSTVSPVVDDSSLKPTIRKLREQMVSMAAAHRKHADTLTLAVLSPLRAFIEQHRRAISKKKTEVDMKYTALKQLALDIEARKVVYIQRCLVADEEHRKFQERGKTSNSPVMIGSRSVGAGEFAQIVESMKGAVKTKSIMTDLGLFEGCFMGDDAIDFLHKRYPGVPRSDFSGVCQEMLNRRLITVVVGPNDSRFDRQLPYQFGRPQLRSGEPPHVKARADAETAKAEYESAIKIAEHTRSALEFHITDYLIAVEDAERYRLKVVKEAACALESAQVFAADEVRSTWQGAPGDELATSVPNRLQTPEPSSALHYIASTYRTGHIRSKPFVFESYYSGRAPHQIFGIPLDELYRTTETAIPSLVSKCVASLHESFVNGRSTIDTWVTRNMDLPSVQFLRLEFDGAGPFGDCSEKRTSSEGEGLDSKGVAMTQLARYDPKIVAGVLKLYLVELPISLCPGEAYEGVGMLYSDDFRQLDDHIRITSIKSLLSTLTKPHFETLKLFLGYLHLITKDLPDTDDRILSLALILSPCILRPPVESPTTLQDTHPERFALEVIVRYDEFFGSIDPETFKYSPTERKVKEEVKPVLSIEGGDVPQQAQQTPPLREPMVKRGWFPWPLSVTTALASATKSPTTPTSAKPLLSPANDVEETESATGSKKNSRASRLEERLAGLMARNRARMQSVAVPGHEDTTVPMTPITEKIDQMEQEKEVLNDEGEGYVMKSGSKEKKDGWLTGIFGKGKKGEEVADERAVGAGPADDDTVVTSEKASSAEAAPAASIVEHVTEKSESTQQADRRASAQSTSSSSSGKSSKTVTGVRKAAVELLGGVIGSLAATKATEEIMDTVAESNPKTDEVIEDKEPVDSGIASPAMPSPTLPAAIDAVVLPVTEPVDEHLDDSGDDDVPEHSSVLSPSFEAASPYDAILTTDPLDIRSTATGSEYAASEYESTMEESESGSDSDDNESESDDEEEENSSRGDQENSEQANDPAEVEETDDEYQNPSFAQDLNEYLQWG